MRTGKVGSEVGVDEANECARQCALNALAAVRSQVGDLSAVTRIVKVVGFVASAPGFTAQPQVVNGASELLGQVFGDAGQHARSAVGVAVLPLDAPVEVEMIVEVG
jgi:enamine deaminase RidA (YjgF/YER057c/UK114 family)